MQLVELAPAPLLLLRALLGAGGAVLSRESLSELLELQRLRARAGHDSEPPAVVAAGRPPGGDGGQARLPDPRLATRFPAGTRGLSAPSPLMDGRGRPRGCLYYRPVKTGEQARTIPQQRGNKRGKAARLRWDPISTTVPAGRLRPPFERASTCPLRHPSASAAPPPAPRIVIAGAGPAAQALVSQLDRATVPRNRHRAEQPGRRPGGTARTRRAAHVSVRFGQPASFIRRRQPAP